MKSMVRISGALIACLCSLGIHAAPISAIESSEVKGMVKVAAWRKGVEITRVEYINGKPIEERIEYPSHWIIVLKDVVGLTRQQIHQIGFHTSITDLQDVIMRRSYDPEKGDLLLRVGGSLDMEISEGKQLEFYGFEFDGDEWGGALRYEELKIAGKPYSKPDVPDKDGGLRVN